MSAVMKTVLPARDSPVTPSLQRPAGEKIGERTRDHARFEGQIGEEGQVRTGARGGRPYLRRGKRI